MALCASCWRRGPDDVMASIADVLASQRRQIGQRLDSFMQQPVGLWHCSSAHVCIAAARV